MLPSWLQAVVLGVVQGLSEFIPVSSSGHLVLVPHLLGWDRPGLAFDVALHIGTALAIVVFFRSELAAMLRGLFGGGDDPEASLYRRLALLIVAATVPVGIVGLALEGFFAEVFESPVAAASFLFVTAALLWSGERWRTRRVRQAGSAGTSADAAAPKRLTRMSGPALAAEPLPRLSTGADSGDPAGLGLDRLGPGRAVAIGAAQVLALFPGVSRSGTTIVAGMFAGLTREAATRFSFLLGLPAMAGAAVVSLPDLGDGLGLYTVFDVALGMVASFISGYAAIRFLVALVARERLIPFAIYCLIAGAAALTVMFL